MKLKLLQVGEPVLRQQARTLTREEIVSPAIQDLIASMRETLREAPGVGLAAPQIGESVQLAIIEDLPEYSHEISAEDLAARQRQPVPFQVIANPKLRIINGKSAEFFEGCLSLAGFTALVPRASEVLVECLDANGQATVIRASGWYARILQHEIDHLNGAIYIDRMYRRTFMSAENYKEHWKTQSIEAVKGRLGDRQP